ATLGTRLLLVGHRDVDPQAARRLAEAVYASEFSKVIQPPVDPKLLDAPPEFPWHEGTVQYHQRNQPLLSGPLMDFVHKGVAILVAAVSGLFVLWQWGKQRGAFMRDEGFNKYIRQLSQIERQVVQAETSDDVNYRQLMALREQLFQLKSEALDRFSEG